MKKHLEKLLQLWNKELALINLRLEDKNITETYRHRLLGEKKVLKNCLKDVVDMLFAQVTEKYSDCLCTFEILPDGNIVKTSECDYHKPINDF